MKVNDCEMYIQTEYLRLEGVRFRYPGGANDELTHDLATLKLEQLLDSTSCCFVTPNLFFSQEFIVGARLSKTEEAYK